MSLYILSSCKKDYIIYYNKVNEIDSIYRMANNPKLAIEKYRDLFKDYAPKNQERIEEYATYIALSDKYKEDFGGKESLYKLIPLISPYDNKYKKFLPLFKKYGIDSIEVKQKIADWKKDLNKRLIDSFSVAAVRDQLGRPSDTTLVRKNEEKNAALLIWTFKKYGFPSIQEIGLVGNNGVAFHIPTLLTHMSESKLHYPYFKTKILEYVKSGDCLPRDYSMLVDSHEFSRKKVSYYGMGRSFQEKIDTVEIDRHRKSIGLPSIKHTEKLKKDYFAQLKKNKTNDTDHIKK